MRASASSSLGSAQWVAAAAATLRIEPATYAASLASYEWTGALRPAALSAQRAVPAAIARPAYMGGREFSLLPSPVTCFARPVFPAPAG